MTNKQRLEYVFKQWLEMFMVVAIEHWSRLSVYERDILLDNEWHIFLKNLEDEFSKKDKTEKTKWVKLRYMGKGKPILSNDDEMDLGADYVEVL